eukprot:CAMPEP_0170466374 /NCGR_PEP_ID=MMETSP0123-20130129/10361_1 /TAXON_ID=182087 /ORGANISM="Favella ehrenbergii, Strain Fehren 1" /LENGTH=153 /DNA_ID=CAMNT_0010732493 /DNA_START=12 /DNA_END=473 /DNA_ORIENTATION=+
MAESANIVRLREMLTFVSPNPAGTVSVAGDNLKKVMVAMGFEFMVVNDAGIQEVRDAVDSGGRGFVPIDEFASYLDNAVIECTDEQALKEAFKQFDADNDNKLTMEEFEFFMGAFAKEYNHMMDRKIVEEMLAIIYREGIANKQDAQPMFDID